MAAWHVLFEALAYFAAFQYYQRHRNVAGDFLAAHQRSTVIVAAILGAVVGSKVLDWLTDPALTLEHWRDPGWLLGGKTIVGALLGGTFAVEMVKRRIGVTRRTGDLFAIPLALGIAIGRVGCFLDGLEDHTYGTPTQLPWAVDFGDGIGRHPTQLYELIAMLVAIPLLRRLEDRPHREGDAYRAFLTGYMAWRLAIDFLKPDPRFGGLTTIQWAAAAALVWYSRDIVRFMRMAADGKEPVHG